MKNGIKNLSIVFVVCLLAQGHSLYSARSKKSQRVHSVSGQTQDASVSSPAAGGPVLSTLPVWPSQIHQSAPSQKVAESSQKYSLTATSPAAGGRAPAQSRIPTWPEAQTQLATSLPALPPIWFVRQIIPNQVLPDEFEFVVQATDTGCYHPDGRAIVTVQFKGLKNIRQPMHLINFSTASFIPVMHENNYFCVRLSKDYNSRFRSNHLATMHSTDRRFTMKFIQVTPDSYVLCATNGRYANPLFNENGAVFFIKAGIQSVANPTTKNLSFAIAQMIKRVNQEIYNKFAEQMHHLFTYEAKLAGKTIWEVGQNIPFPKIIEKAWISLTNGYFVDDFKHIEAQGLSSDLIYNFFAAWHTQFYLNLPNNGFKRDFPVRQQPKLAAGEQVAEVITHVEVDTKVETKTESLEPTDAVKRLLGIITEAAEGTAYNDEPLLVDQEATQRVRSLLGVASPSVGASDSEELSAKDDQVVLQEKDEDVVTDLSLAQAQAEEAQARLAGTSLEEQERLFLQVATQQQKEAVKEEEHVIRDIQTDVVTEYVHRRIDFASLMDYASSALAQDQSKLSKAHRKKLAKERQEELRKAKVAQARKKKEQEARAKKDRQAEQNEALVKELKASRDLIKKSQRQVSAAVEQTTKQDTASCLAQLEKEIVRCKRFQIRAKVNKRAEWNIPGHNVNDSTFAQQIIGYFELYNFFRRKEVPQDRDPAYYDECYDLLTGISQSLLSWGEETFKILNTADLLCDEEFEERIQSVLWQIFSVYYDYSVMQRCQAFKANLWDHTKAWEPSYIEYRGLTNEQWQEVKEHGLGEYWAAFADCYGHIGNIFKDMNLVK